MRMFAGFIGGLAFSLGIWSGVTLWNGPEKVEGYTIQQWQALYQKCDDTRNEYFNLTNLCIETLKKCERKLDEYK